MGDSGFNQSPFSGVIRQCFPVNCLSRQLGLVEPQDHVLMGDSLEVVYSSHQSPYE